ncbi:MAG: glycosyl transferase family protein [Pseudomonadota bacterium]
MSADSPDTFEHPFAPFVRILGKGKTGSRSFSRQEAEQSMGMILRGEVQDVQLGAFLMLLRVKEETPEEIAGFVDACRDQMVEPPTGLTADLDWPSYAGKRHQHPWYLLSILLLSSAGYRVFLHGSAGHTPGRLYTEQAMLSLGLPVADGWRTAAAQLDDRGFCYLPLEAFCPRLHDILQLRSLLGLRSPVNTLTRLLNPLQANCSIQSIFHPAYAAIHQQGDQLLGQPAALVLKGESGEIEVKPHADVRLNILRDGASHEVTLNRSQSERPDAVDQPGVEPLRALWRGVTVNRYGEDAVLSTTTAALLLLRADLNTLGAMQLARELWEQRDRHAVA